jgi:hypothetical protein
MSTERHRVNSRILTSCLLLVAFGCGGPKLDSLGRLIRADGSVELGSSVMETEDQNEHCVFSHVLRNGKEYLVLERMTDRRSHGRPLTEHLAELEIPILQPDEALAYGYSARPQGYYNRTSGCWKANLPERSCVVGVIDRGHGCPTDTTVKRAWMVSVDQRSFAEIAPAGLACNNVWWVEGCPGTHLTPR